MEGFRWRLTTKVALEALNYFKGGLKLLGLRISEIIKICQSQTNKMESTATEQDGQEKIYIN